MGGCGTCVALRLHLQMCALKHPQNPRLNESRDYGCRKCVFVDVSLKYDDHVVKSLANQTVFKSWNESMQLWIVLRSIHSEMDPQCKTNKDESSADNQNSWLCACMHYI